MNKIIIHHTVENLLLKKFDKLSDWDKIDWK